MGFEHTNKDNEEEAEYPMQYEGGGEEAIKQAHQMLENDPVLRRDPHARNVVEAGGKITIDGRQVVLDLDEFLAIRREILTANSHAKRAAYNPEQVMVVHSGYHDKGTIH